MLWQLRSSAVNIVATLKMFLLEAVNVVFPCYIHVLTFFLGLSRVCGFAMISVHFLHTHIIFAAYCIDVVKILLQFWPTMEKLLQWCYNSTICFATTGWEYAIMGEGDLIFYWYFFISPGTALHKHVLTHILYNCRSTLSCFILADASFSANKSCTKKSLKIHIYKVSFFSYLWRGIFRCTLLPMFLNIICFSLFRFSIQTH